MSVTSPKLQLPLIAPSQAMKHVTHNEALMRLDTITQLTVTALEATMPPAAPAAGACYGLGTGAQGAWAGHDAELAVFFDGGWRFVVPQAGWRVWDLENTRMLVFSAGQWMALDMALNNLDGLGINASYDATNRLAVASDASLFNHDGAGHQIKLNKSGATDTASMVFQSGFNGHGEIGLVGDNDLTFKVSADGVTFQDGLKMRGSDGLVDMPCVRSGRVNLALDTVVDIPTPGVGGMVALSLSDAAFPQTSHSGLFAFDSGGTLSLRTLAAAGGIVNENDTLLTGTTGLTGRTNFSARPGVLQIENRYKANTYYSYTFLNAF